ncbi:hypothetical protein DY023_06535 [Microbacterium bovistercoris]|uniref:Uncharacterized protein n=1 Tax=Microbacterium bovistercoris TaxID=2293570 RepID=A0A371NUV5_9MICO|nr:hypothetical protein [Microbacterium bovistercoris]REJ06282.1 hypothetical protein DY023_06535 [Microbacterium bovistercoris]
MTEQRAALTGVALPAYRITPQASKTLHDWADKLAAGDLRLWQLPPAVCALYWLGYNQGVASRDEEVHQLRIDADRMWLLAMPATDRREYLLERLDNAARLADRPDVDDVLDEAWRMYCASLDTIREPVRLASTEHGREAA